MAIEHERRITLIRIAMQVGNDYYGKLKSFSLVDGHESHDVCRFIHLAFAFAAADSFELFDVMHKVANQKTRPFELLSQPEKFFHVRNSLRAIKVGGNNNRKFRATDGIAQEVSDAIAMTSFNQRLEPNRNSIQNRVFHLINKLDFAM